MSIFSISGVCDRCVVRMHWKPGLYLIYPGFKAQTLIANRDLQKKAASQLVWRQPLREEDCWEKEINEKNIKSRGNKRHLFRKEFQSIRDGNKLTACPLPGEKPPLAEYAYHVESIAIET